MSSCSLNVKVSFKDSEQTMHGESRKPFNEEQVSELKCSTNADACKWHPGVVMNRNWSGYIGCLSVLKGQSSGTWRRCFMSPEAVEQWTNITLEGQEDEEGLAAPNAGRQSADHPLLQLSAPPGLASAIESCPQLEHTSPVAASRPWMITGHTIQAHHETPLMGHMCFKSTGKVGRICGCIAVQILPLPNPTSFHRYPPLLYILHTKPSHHLPVENLIYDIWGRTRVLLSILYAVMAPTPIWWTTMFPCILPQVTLGVTRQCFPDAPWKGWVGHGRAAAFFDLSCSVIAVVPAQS